MDQEAKRPCHLPKPGGVIGLPDLSDQASDMQGNAAGSVDHVGFRV